MMDRMVEIRRSRDGLKRCNSEYSKQLIKNCKRGEWRNGAMYCKCEGSCESCTVLLAKLPMHPDLYEKWQQKQKITSTGGSSPKGLKKN
jgi:hypothetical protein